MAIRSATYVVLALLLSGCRKDPLDLSDREAKRLIEQQWRSRIDSIPIGRLTIVRNGSNIDWRKGEWNQEGLKVLRAWEQVGAIRISEVQDLAKKFSGWEDWFALTQRGVLLRLLSSEGPKAPELQCTEAQLKKVRKLWGDVRCLCAPPDDTIVERIVRNELHAVGADHYRMIMGTYIDNRSGISEKFWNSFSGTKWNPARKFIVALKNDPFSDQWTFAGQDLADRDQEFPTHFVTQLLRVK